MSSPDLAFAANLFRANANSVLFVTSQLRPRELKMADGLRRLGWAVGLIYCKWTPFDPLKYFDFCIEADSYDEAHSYASKLSPSVTHVFSGAIDNLVLQFCRQKPSPVVIDLNDVFAPSLFDYCHERFEPTREALALADGFCARDLQVKSAERADKFRLPPQLLLFPEYSWNITLDRQELTKRTQSDEVRIVSVGTFSLESQGMYDSCYLQLAQLLIGQGIHFHIYPHWAYRRDHTGSPNANFERDFADFLALEKTSPYLHVHESLPLDELAKALPQYDFGIVSGGCAQFGQKLGFYYPAYLETCYSGRISDYLDARLPVLVNEEVKFDYWLLKRYGACVDLKGVLQPGFRQYLLNLKRATLQHEIMENAAWKLSVDCNSPRLAAFYLKVATAGSCNNNVTPLLVTSKDEQINLSINAETIHMPTDVEARSVKQNQLIATLYKNYRWAAPRAAKIILPYRAIRIFETRLHNALQENQSHTTTIAALHTRISGLEQDKTAALSHVAALEQHKSAALLQVAGLERDKANLQEQIAGLEQSKIALHAQVSGLEQDKSAVLSQEAGLERDKAELQAQIAGLEQSKIALHAQVSGLEQDKSAVLSQVAGLERDKAELQAQIAGLEQNKIALHTRISGLEQDKSAALSQVAGLERDKAELRTQITSLDQDKIALHAQVSGLEQDKSAAISQVANLEQGNAVLRSQIEELRQNHSTYLAQLENMEKEAGVLSQRIHVLSNEKFVLQQEAKWGKLPLNEIAGVLNWPEVLDDVERSNGFSDLVRIMGLFSKTSSPVDRHSACWDALAIKNYDQLLTSGYNNFKRTIGNNYFNFLVQKGDPQIQAAESLLSPEIVESCRQTAGAIPEVAGFPCPDQFSYNYFVLLLWEYAKKIDTGRHLEALKEPEEGNPILIPYEGRSISQDLANSLIEYYAIGEAVPFEHINTVLEIGGGYGRDAYVILALNPKVRVTVVDIPPALYIAQRYLSSVFKDRRVFRAREFSRYEDVREELEAASIVFLMPHQLELMPEKYFDLSMNISSFGEMGKEQIDWYFGQLGRVTNRYFYMKQWHTSNNVFDGVLLNEGDYPYPESWRKIYSRPCSVQNDFFEALYQVSES